MTLQEYLNQKNPVQFPNVVLTEGEYVERERWTGYHLGEKVVFVLIRIPQLDAKYKSQFWYISKVGYKTLYTNDNGVLNRPSCFSLENPLT